VGPRVPDTAIDGQPAEIDSIASALAQAWPMAAAEASNDEIHAVWGIRRLCDDRQQMHRIASKMASGEPPTVGGFDELIAVAGREHR
jgi:hypothetical protein